MGRGRGQGANNEVALRTGPSAGTSTGDPISATPDVLRDIISFRQWWHDADIMSRAEYAWPMSLDYLDLSGLDMKGTDLRTRSLQGTNIEGADFRGAILDGADFTHARIKGAWFDDGADKAASFSLDEDKTLDEATRPDPHEYTTRLEGIVHAWVDEQGEYHNYPKWPSYRRYSVEGKLLEEKYYQHGTLHRDEGPAVLEYFENGNISKEIYMHDGMRSRLGGEPAFTAYYESGRLKEAEWGVDDVVTRGGDLPSYESYYSYGAPKSQVYYDDQIISRAVGPAKTTWHENGKIKEEIYMVDGVLTREGGEPAHITWHKNGVKAMEVYAVDNQPYREQGPTMRRWREDGSLIEEEYSIPNPELVATNFDNSALVADHEFMNMRYRRGLTHRNPLEGPARIDYHENGQIDTEVYMENGEPIKTGLVNREFYPSGKVRTERYARRSFSTLYEQDDPNYPPDRDWHENGQLKEEQYFQGEGIMPYKRIEWDEKGNVVRSYDNS